MLLTAALLALVTQELAQAKQELFPAYAEYRNVLAPDQEALFRAQVAFEKEATPQAAALVLDVCRHRYLTTNRPIPARRCLHTRRTIAGTTR